MNYPLLPEPAPDRKPTKKYVADTLNNYIHRLKGIPDLCCVMLSKIARMIVTIITSVNDMAQAGAQWTTYFKGPDGLAWDLQESPSKEILMGLYARCIFLLAHWMVTFEEAFYTGFFEVETKIFSLMNQDPQSRYIAFRTMEVDRPLTYVLAKAELKAKIARFQGWF